MRTRSSFAVGGIALAVATALASTATAQAASNSVSTGFENGLSEVSATYSNAVVSPSAARNGGYGLDLTAQASVAFAKFDTTQIAQGHPYFSIRSYVKVVSSTPQQSVDLLTVKNAAGVNNFDLFLNTGGYFQWDLLGANSAVSASKPLLGTWHLIEAKGYFGASTYTADVRIDGVTQGSISSVSQNPTTVAQYVFGSNGNSSTNEKYLDDPSVTVGDVPLAFLGAPNPLPPTTTTTCAITQLTGSVNPNGQSTTWHFDYGTTTAYGSSKPATDGAVTAGSATVNVNSGSMNGLAPNTVYHYRLTSRNAAGTAYGADRTIVTGSQPC